LTDRLCLFLLASPLLFGQADLHGIWTNTTITPLERPLDLADKNFFTPEEAGKHEWETNQRNDADNPESSPEGDVNHAYNQFWWDRATKVVPGLRTSFIVDPLDGRIPPLTPAAQKRVAALSLVRASIRRMARRFD
jgi:hypothetical protein